MPGLRYDLDDVERAIRNIARGENAKSLIVGQIQARIVRTFMEEGILPLELLEKGLIHDLGTIIKKEKKLNAKHTKRKRKTTKNRTRR